MGGYLQIPLPNNGGKYAFCPFLNSSGISALISKLISSLYSLIKFKPELLVGLPYLLNFSFSNPIDQLVIHWCFHLIYL